MGDNGVVLTFTGVTEESQVTIKTPQGDVVFKLADVPLGKTVEQLKGAVELQRTAAAFPMTSEGGDDDYPSAATGPDGTAWVAYTRYTPGIDRNERAKSYQAEPADLKFLAKPPGADQLWLQPVNGHEAGAPVAITAAGRDIYKSAVAVAGDGTVWVAWAENTAYKPFPDNPAPQVRNLGAAGEGREARRAGEAFHLAGERRLAGGGDGQGGARLDRVAGRAGQGLPHLRAAPGGGRLVRAGAGEHADAQLLGAGDRGRGRRAGGHRVGHV